MMEGKKVKRYRFLDYFGMPRGIQDTDNLHEAIETAIEFQCEIFDFEKKEIVFSVWDGFNKEWREAV